MGKFDGYLICTDFDGTFATKGMPVEINLPVVRYFMENGGHFSVFTGRGAEIMREKGLPELVNTPVSLLNGSLVYDYDREEALWKRFLPFDLAQFVAQMGALLDEVVAMDLFADGETLSFLKPSQLPESHLHIPMMKILCRAETPEAADTFLEKAKKLLPSGSCYVSKSWNIGVEFNPIDGKKGDALKFLKALMPQIHTAVGVGNFDNDLSLLQQADISAAPANAEPEILAAAKMRLVNCEEGAIADLIRQLEAQL